MTFSPLRSWSAGAVRLALFIVFAGAHLLGTRVGISLAEERPRASNSSRPSQPPRNIATSPTNPHPRGATARVTTSSFVPEQVQAASTQRAPTSTVSPASARIDRPHESPDGYWIISSRDVRGTPAVDDSVRQLRFLYCTPDGMNSVAPETFFATLRPDRPVCIVTHGSYNYWNDVIRESERNHEWVRQAAGDRDVQFVYFTWPSDGYAHVVFPVELRMMGRRAAVHGGYLAQLVSEFPADQPVTLMGHSHGARCAVAALHALGGGSLDDGSHLPAGSAAPRRIRGVLIAAAVDHDWLNPGNRYGRAIEPIESLLVIHNHRDGWLSVYPLHSPFKGRQALGRKGFHLKDREQLDGYGQKIQLLDSSSIAGRSHDFSTFNTSPEMAAAIAPYVTFEPVDRRQSSGHQ